MEHGWSRPWALGYDMRLYGVAGMINSDNLNLGQDHVIWLKRVKMKIKKDNEQRRKNRDIIANQCRLRCQREQIKINIRAQQKHLSGQIFLQFATPTPRLSPPWPFQSELLSRLHSLSSKSCGVRLMALRWEPGSLLKGSPSTPPMPFLQ